MMAPPATKQVNVETGICFFKVPTAQGLRNFLEHADFDPLCISPDASRVDGWFEFGCIYVDGRRQRVDVEVTTNAVIRVHTRPKRFFSERIPLRNRLVEDNDEFLILDKPGDLPTHPTLDNYVENAKTLLERELGQTLYTTHRLDVPTEGLLILAKTQDAQRLINKAFSRGRVTKVYRCLNRREVALGLHVHYMDPESRVPKVTSSEAREGWWNCQLRVDRAQLHGANMWWHELTLLTGKTHQIRAQMRALGAPILGDPIYGGESNFEHVEGQNIEYQKTVRERLALECYSLSFAFRSRTCAVNRSRSLVAPAFNASTRA